MAAPKKKAPAKKATSRKKPVTKKPAAKRTTNKSTTRSKTKKAPAMQPFRVSRPTEPFLSYKFGQQSVYWLIISLSVLALGTWVLRLETEIHSIYDQIEKNDMAHDRAMIDYDNRMRTSQPNEE